MRRAIFSLTILLSISGNSATCNYYVSAEYINNINSQGLPWKAGNNFPDGLNVDQMNKMAGSGPPQRSRSRFNTDDVNDGSGIYQTDFPDILDLRTEHPYCPSIGTVYNQGYCKSSWAIATASTLTDHVCIKTKGDRRTPFSAQYILSCAKSSGNGCDGGWDDMVFFFFFRYYGVVTGGDYGSNTGCQPYEIPPCISNPTSNSPNDCVPYGNDERPTCEDGCTNANYTVPFDKDVFKTRGLSGVATRPDIKVVLNGKGPLENNFAVYTDLFHYKSGVYKVSRNATLIGYHSVKIIGYGVEKGIQYWLAVNSWGTNWGINGTFKVAAYTNNVGFERHLIYPVLHK